MCTAISLKAGEHYFGRTLDIACSYNERVVVTPRKRRLEFRNGISLGKHYAMIGMAAGIDSYPLYYDAINEVGLATAGLNFPSSTCYHGFDAEKENIAAFEFIPWILGNCRSIRESEHLLAITNITSDDFSPDLSVSPLHWIISDGERSLTVESLGNGLKVSENKVGVLTNEPLFDWHMLNLQNYINLTVEYPKNPFFDKSENYSNGLGAVGLPGDYSSASRFVRAVFLKKNSCIGDTEAEKAERFFKILDAVALIRGCEKNQAGEMPETIYSSCMNADRGIYYYTTCKNRRINAVNMKNEVLDSSELISYALEDEADIRLRN